MPTQPVLHRPLSVMERSCWHANRVDALNGQAIAEVEGDLPVASIRKALDFLQQRYPLLNVGIRREGGRIVFRRGVVPPIPMRVLEIPKEKWVEEAEAEVKRSVTCETGPQARCVLLRHGDSRSTILMTFPHIVGEGYSWYLLIRDLLEKAAGADPRNVEGEMAYLPVSLYDRLPTSVKGVSGFTHFAGMLSRELAGYIREGGAPRRLDLDLTTPFAERRTRLTPVRFDRAFTGRLLDRSRREGTSVHGAICAAGLLAVSKVMTDGSPRVFACTSAVDMRKRLTPPIGEEMGLFVSVLWAVQRVQQDGSFWDLARKIREKLAAKIALGDPSVVASGGSMLLPALECLPGRDRSGRIVKLAESFMYNFKGTGVSNLGRTELPEQMGGFTVKSISFSGSLVNLGYFLSVVNTFNGALNVNYLFNEPLIDQDRARVLAKTAEAFLKGSVD
ncbi:condensation domain-containing protein [Thermodesulfobacteriota bacterium]